MKKRKVICLKEGRRLNFACKKDSHCMQTHTHTHSRMHRERHHRSSGAARGDVRVMSLQRKRKREMATVMLKRTRVQE